MSEGKFECLLHGESYDGIPKDAVQIGAGHPTRRLFRFADNTHHLLRNTEFCRAGSRKNSRKAKETICTNTKETN